MTGASPTVSTPVLGNMRGSSIGTSESASSASQITTTSLAAVVAGALTRRKHHCTWHRAMGIRMSLSFLSTVRMQKHRTKINAPPLLLASRCEYVEVARVLLTYGADRKARDSYIRTPLLLASMCGYVEVARVLLEHRADKDAQDKRGWSPLMHASKMGHLEVIRVLLEYGNPGRGWVVLIDSCVENLCIMHQAMDD
jgi:hypothetical protein